MTLNGDSIVTCDSHELLLLAPTIRSFLNEAYDGDFSDSDFQNALGGQHFIRFDSGRLIAHASVVERSISIDEQLFRVAYVEAVAVAADFRGRKIGSQLMQTASDHCRDSFEVAMLSTGEYGFYERFGWSRLEARSFVETANGLIRTEEEDECLMLLSEKRELKDASRVVAHDRAESPW